MVAGLLTGSPSAVLAEQRRPAIRISRLRESADDPFLDPDGQQASRCTAPSRRRMSTSPPKGGIGLVEVGTGASQLQLEELAVLVADYVASASANASVASVVVAAPESVTT